MLKILKNLKSVKRWLSQALQIIHSSETIKSLKKTNKLKTPNQGKHSKS